MTSEPSTAELITLGAPVTLRDGSRVRLRQGHRADRGLLLRGFERLSPESRYRRFLAPIPDIGLAPALRRLLQITSKRDVAVPPVARA